ncbi:protein FAR1-RELATED SEQUENCE 3-like [Arachis duranensis]|uniref:Protein FAR1-RELATED SEQUENCE n=1 Tax=Arachis duranensis TaxID=130453 RepID=A0A6P5MXR6_ARADU|nr:protein FAR1-RELATED SEQUENCE 3-like [Arachis duranensis]
MNQKAPVSIITDGDSSMKFTIEKEFPNAHHRLCAWHLIYNATCNIGKPQFTSMFKKYMLGDYEIDWKEAQADLTSVNGKPSMQTCFEQLERSTANVYTLSIFYMFQQILVRAASMKVINMTQIGSYVIYSVGLDRTTNEMWRVFFCDIEMEFNCSCMRVESFGIPCEHTVCVLVHKDIDELPRSLVLPR